MWSKPQPITRVALQISSAHGKRKKSPRAEWETSVQNGKKVMQ